MYFWQKQGVIKKTFEYLAKIEKTFKMFDILCWISIGNWVMQKKVKTDYENLVHVYL